MKPFITWKQSNGMLLGLAGDTVFFTLTEVSGKKNNKTYALYANIIGRHVAYYRTESEGKISAEATVEHFLKSLGFWQCVVDRESVAA